MQSYKWKKQTSVFMVVDVLVEYESNSCFRKSSAYCELMQLYDCTYVHSKKNK